MRHSVRLPSTLVLAASLLAFTGIASAWKTATGFSFDWDKVLIQTTRLTDHTYFLQGSGGNMVVSTGRDGVLLVDDEFPQIADKIKKAVAALQPGPIRYLINTHWHSDHAGGNQSISKDGTVILAHDNCRARMMADQFNLFFKIKTEPAPREALPVITFKDSMTLHFNDEDIQLFYVTPAHTDGDAIVYFPKSNVVHMGDVYINELYPIIDVASKGTINGYAPTIDKVLSLINDDTKVIPGHGPIGTKKSLKAYRDMLVVIRDRVKKMMDEGKSPDEIINSNPSREYDTAWASDRVGPDHLVTMIYQTLSGKSLKDLWTPPEAFKPKPTPKP